MGTIGLYEEKRGPRMMRMSANERLGVWRGPRMRANERLGVGKGPRMARIARMDGNDSREGEVVKSIRSLLKSDKSQDHCKMYSPPTSLSSDWRSFAPFAGPFSSSLCYSHLRSFAPFAGFLSSSLSHSNWRSFAPFAGKMYSRGFKS
jgi:hypothetical protein